MVGQQAALLMFCIQLILGEMYPRGWEELMWACGVVPPSLGFLRFLLLLRQKRAAPESFPFRWFDLPLAGLLIFWLWFMNNSLHII